MPIKEQERDQKLEELAKANKYADVLVGQMDRNASAFILDGEDNADKRVRLQMVFHALCTLAEKYEYSCRRGGVPLAAVSRLKANGLTRAATILENDLLNQQIKAGGGGIIQ